MQRWTLLLIAWPTLVAAFDIQRFSSPDGTLVAVVEPVGVKSYGRGESCIVIQDWNGRVRSRKCFKSDDGKHGYGVERAAWTPDSQFFVYSVSSSGGHQAWSFPTYFYAKADDRTRLLDDFVGAITDPEFHVKEPDVVSTITSGSPTIHKEGKHVTSLGSLVRKEK